MSYTRVQQYSSLLLAIVALAAVVASVALSLPYSWLLAVALLGAALLALSPAYTAQRTSGSSTTHSHNVRAAIEGQVGEQRRLTLPDGNERVGRVVPLAQDHVWALVLTREGYVLVDESGRVRHTLKGQ